MRLAMARLWRAVNRHGGDAKLVHLPEIGITGNTHFLMSDLNNVEIADRSRSSSPRRISTDPHARALRVLAIDKEIEMTDEVMQKARIARSSALVLRCNDRS